MLKHFPLTEIFKAHNPTVLIAFVVQKQDVNSLIGLQEAPRVIVFRLFQEEVTSMNNDSIFHPCSGYDT